MPLAFLSFDVLFTLTSRIIERRGVMKPHKDYLFHRLLTAGLSHQFISSIYFALALIMVVLTLLYSYGHITFIHVFVIYLITQILFVFWVFSKRAVAR